MIAVSMHPNEIPLGQPTDVVLRLTNTGPGVCTNVRFTFRVTREILLIRGRRQVQIDQLREGQQHDHLLQLQARQLGVFELVSTNFSYRDSTGRGQRVPETVLCLQGVAPVAPCPVPAPVLDLTLETTSLPVGAWSPLLGHIANVGKAPAWRITLSASGPALQVHKETLGDLPPGEALHFTLSVHATQIGTHVPIRLEATFRDDSGQLCRHSLPVHLAVEEARPSTEIAADDIFRSYREGLKQLLARLEQEHPRYPEGLVLQSRLLENIFQAQQYGDTETHRAARAQVLDALNRLTMEALGYSFNQLCGLSDSTVQGQTG